MFFLRQFFRWFRNQRSSTRLSFLLQIICRIGFSLCSFIWTPLLLGSMGKSLNGLFLNFQKITSLGGLGDLGMGAVVNIRTSRLLGQGRESELRTFLANARGLYFGMALATGLVFCAISPFLFKVLKFAGDQQVGSLSLLAMIGGAAIAFVILNSYINNVNYGCGNTAWPVVPTFVLLQLAVLGHWLLARQHYPLWTQYVPYVAAAVLIHATGWFYARISFPPLATAWPLKFNRKSSAELLGTSLWAYLNVVGTGIWYTTDILLITARFGPQIIPAYQYNFKLCEIALFFVVSANQMSLPKITQWLVSPDAATRERGVQELHRVNQFQTFLGCCAALVYLNVNNGFMGFWLGKDYLVPLLWQGTFAGILAVTGAGAMGAELAPRCCDGGIRYNGVVCLLAELLNLCLALTAVTSSSVLGMNLCIFAISLAMVIVLSALHLTLGRFAARQLKISWWKLTVKNWLLALATLSFGILIRFIVPPENGMNVSVLVVINLIAFFIIMRIIGISLKDLRQEKDIFLTMFRKQTESKRAGNGEETP